MHSIPEVVFEGLLKLPYRPTSNIPYRTPYIFPFLQVCTFCSTWGFVVMVPIYLTGGRHRDDFQDTFAEITMDNLKKGSDQLWASAIFHALVNFYALYSINRGSRHQPKNPLSVQFNCPFNKKIQNTTCSQSGLDTLRCAKHSW